MAQTTVSRVSSSFPSPLVGSRQTHNPPIYVRGNCFLVVFLLVALLSLANRSYWSVQAPSPTRSLRPSALSLPEGEVHPPWVNGNHVRTSGRKASLRYFCKACFSMPRAQHEKSHCAPYLAACFHSMLFSIQFNLSTILSHFGWKAVVLRFYTLSREHTSIR